MMTDSELSAVLARFPDLRMGVVGDFALDGYWAIDFAASVPSVETGKPTRPVLEQRYAGGAAANVVSNLVGLGCRHVSAFGVVGEDPFGTELLRIMNALGVDCVGVEKQKRDWDTVAYIKPHRDVVEQNRIDFGDFNRIHDKTVDRLISRLEPALRDLDGLIINVQARTGIHSARFRRRLSALIDARPNGVFVVDSREPRAFYAGCALKINHLEAMRYCGLTDTASAGTWREKILAAAERIFAERGLPVFITRGAEGMVVCDRDGITEIPAVVSGFEVDSTGAGDAALSAIAAALACGISPVRAAVVGTLAAAVCVRKLRQTGTATPEAMRALLKHTTGSVREGRAACEERNPGE